MCQSFSWEMARSPTARPPWNRRRARKAGRVFVAVDGAFVPIGRVTADRPLCSAKPTHHGMNVRGVAAPDGTVLWASGSPPGAVHGTRAARVLRIAERIRAAGPVVLSGKGSIGLDKVVLVPLNGRGEPRWTKAADPKHARHRSPGEHTIAPS